MKLSFSTLGCLEWDLDTILNQAITQGFAGVEIRGYRGNLNAYECPEFSSRRSETVKRFRDAGVEVACFASSARVFLDPASSLREVEAYAPLCESFGTPYIRVFAGPIGHVPSTSEVETLCAHLRQVLPAARDHGATLLLETHDDWVQAPILRAVCERVNSPAFGILWDTHHPYRLTGEAPEETCRLLGPYIRHTHWKDSRPNPNKPGTHTYRLLGEGDLPLDRMLSALQRIDYTGFLSLEWERKWHPDLEPPETAIPAFAQFMRKH
jgi:sugar phosphate isomerase/epimerase